MTGVRSQDVLVLLDTDEYLGAEDDRAERILAAARARQATHLTTSLSIAAPSCAHLLEALRSRVGTDVGRMQLRRAGSSVMVDLDLLPRPTPAGDAAPRR